MYKVSIVRVNGEIEQFNHTTLEDAKARYFSLVMGLRKGGDIVYVSLYDGGIVPLYDWEG